MSTTIPGGQTSTAFTVTNCAIDACGRGIAVQGSAVTVVPVLTITDNTIGSATSGNPTTVYSRGMTLQGFGSGTIARNTIRNIESYLATSVQGIGLGEVSASGTLAVVEGNSIFNVYNQNTGTFGAYGINVNVGASITVRNNCIRDVKNSQVAGTGAFSTTFGVFGIRIGTSVGHSVLHNTVHLSGAIPGVISTDLTACLGIVGTGQTGCDVRNNIFSNVLTGGNPTGFSTTHTCIYLPSGGTSAMGLTLNNNAYYVGSTPWSLLGKAGTTVLTLQYTAAAFDASTIVPAANLRSYSTLLHVPATNDNASFAALTAVPLAGGCGIDVSMVPEATPLFLTGASAGVLTDIDGDPRGATPCIGADEFSLAACVGIPGTGTSSLTGGSPICAGLTKNMTNVGATFGSGISYQWQTGPSGGPYVDVTGGTGATTLSYTTDPLAPGTYYYVLKVTCSTGPDEDVSNELTLVVDPTPTASATSNSPICEGQTLNLDGSGGIGTIYSWTGPGYGGGSNEDESIGSATLANNGTFVFTSTLGSCTSAPVNVSVTVNPNPTGVTANASDLTVCDGDLVDLTSGPSSPPGTILTENFNGVAAGWTTTNTTTTTGIGDVSLAAWTLRPNGFVGPIGGANNSNDASQFYMSNADAPGSGSTTNTTLVSPVFSLVGYSSATLSFWHHYNWLGDDNANVEISTNGGGSWAPLVTYAADQGTPTVFANATPSLNAYLGQNTVQVRFRYFATWDWYWAIDNVSVTGTPLPYAYGWTSSPAYFTSGVQNPTGVTVSPVPTTFEVTVTNTATGCFSTASVAVNPDLTDTDGDLIPDCDDDCPTVPGEQGDACDDLDPQTVLDVLNGSCVCEGVACTTDLDFVYQADGVDNLTWAIYQETTNILVQSGGGALIGNGSEATCLPDGCFYLVVTDGGGDGIVNGGYLLKINSSVRLIDNLYGTFGEGGFTSGINSQIANNEGFCLPVSTDRLIYTSCDKRDWKISPCGGEFVVANANQDVSDEYGVNNANSGYQMWWYTPNGGYSFKRFQSHNTSNGLPASATRAAHFQLNAWLGNQLTEGGFYNVKVRGRINGNYNNWGPACRLVVNSAEAQCPRTKLQDQPGNPYLSCGQSRTIGTNVYVHARTVRRMNANCNWVNANRYQFRFRIPAEFVTIVKTSATGKYWVNTNGLTCGKTYEVDVRASFDNGATWCHSSDPYGDICLLTTTCSFGMAEESSSSAAGQSERSVAMYPNPNNGDQLFVSLSNVEEGVESINVDIYDSFGKRVAQRTIRVQDGFVNTTIALNGELANGMYLVSIAAGSAIHTERLVIQK
ncbi:MAG: T9SS type A sorting domain-containing protein [Flavobacteriales bacterium]|nr:T9SS type A sorting domain-containing protein [Flavobacteriales bacterium]